MSKEFTSFKNVLEYLRGYKLTDITRDLVDSNIRNFVTLKRMPIILEALPPRYISAFFSEVMPNFNASKEAFFSLLMPLPTAKKIEFFRSFAHRLEAGMTCEDIDCLLTLMPGYMHEIGNAEWYRGFNIKSTEEAATLLRFFICEQAPSWRPANDAYAKFIRANEGAVQACLNSPQDVLNLVESGTHDNSKPFNASFFAEKLTAGYFNNALEDADAFDDFLEFFGYLHDGRKLQFADNLSQNARLANLNEHQRLQVAQMLNVNRCSLTHDEILCRLYNNNLLTDEQFFNFCLTLSHDDLDTKIGIFSPYDRLNKQILNLTEDKRAALCQRALDWLEAVAPSREEMKRYQRYQEGCYATVSFAGELVKLFFPEDEAACPDLCVLMCVAPLVLALLIAALAVAIIGLIPALIGLCLETKKTQAEQNFIASCGLNDPEVSAEVMDARYLDSQRFWQAANTQNFCGSLRGTSIEARSSDVSSLEDPSLVPCH